MKRKRNAGRWRKLRSVVLLLILTAVGLWQYQQSGLAAANRWSWEDQLAMETEMAKAVQASPGSIPDLDRAIPETETALFALG